MSSTNFRSILIFASWVVGTRPCDTNRNKHEGVKIKNTLKPAHQAKRWLVSESVLRCESTREERARWIVVAIEMKALAVVRRGRRACLLRSARGSEQRILYLDREGKRGGGKCVYDRTDGGGCTRYSCMGVDV